MNMEKNNGLNFGVVLQLVFIVLKLCKIINWSWFWVLFPSILSVSIIIVLFIMILFTKKIKKTEK